MKQVMEKLIKLYNQKSAWYKVFVSMAAVVVFATTYMLILPAITQEAKSYCGAEAHTHSDSCYTEEKKLSCGKKESKGHQHTDACYETEKELVCTNTEEGHEHTDECYKEKKVLTCTKKESEGHTHTSSCYQVTKKLTCGKKEHKHTLECFSNPNADVETASDWEKTLKNVKLTGNWSDDLLAVANTQLGYKESTENYQVEKDGKTIDGYSRYGAWYGNSYGNWCAMYVSFCLHYAGVDLDVMPEDAGCQNWVKQLNSKETPYYYAVNDKNDYKLVNGKNSVCYQKKSEEKEECKLYHPQAGDLIFFNWDKEADADHVGIIEKVEYDKNGNMTKIHTIEGNSSDEVKENVYKADDSQIMGFAKLPENPDLEKEKAASEDKKETTDTATSEEKTEAASEEETEATSEEATSETSEETTEEVIESEEATEDATSDITADDTHIQTYTGDDYSVTVTYSSDAEIPDDAELVAKEYSRKSDQYKYRLSVATDLYGWDTEDLDDIDFRLFNIGFRVDGKEIEPSDDVKVNISYTDMDITKKTSFEVVHFGAKAEAVEADTTVRTGEAQINFTTDSFSDFGTASSSNANLVANFTFAGSAITEATGNAKGTSTGARKARYGYVSVAPNTTDSVSYNMSYSNQYSSNGYKNYLNVTNSSGGSLLSGHGYNEISMDFWMKAVAKSYYTTGDTSAGWLFYIAPNTNTQSEPPTYLGCYVNSSANTITVERFLNGRQTSATLTSSSIAGNMVHVHVDYTTTQIILTLTDSSGNSLGSTTVDNSADIDSILGDNSIMQIGKANWGYGEYFNGLVDEFKVYARTASTEQANDMLDSTHPNAVSFQEPDVTGVFLYNINTNSTVNSGKSTLAGVTYSVYDKSTGAFVNSFTTKSDYSLYLDGLETGKTYIIKQTSVPDGYKIVDQEKEFTVTYDGNGMCFAGYFFDYLEDEGYTPDKTAEVYDYANRIYDITMSSLSGNEKVEINYNKLDFVVDQSNSMLFPAILDDTGKTVTLDVNGTNNNSNMTTAVGSDTTQLYYIKALDDTKATVYAVWYNSSNKSWYYEDAAYYYYAAHRSENSSYSGHRFADESDFSTSSSKGKGGSLGSSITSSDLKSHLNSSSYSNTFKIYTAGSASGSTSKTKYNRLTYLAYATERVVYQLATLSDNSNKKTVTITTFDKYVEGCMTQSIGTDSAGVNGVAKLKNFIESINTSGGTSQDLGLAHVAGTDTTATQSAVTDKNSHSLSDKDIVILITDGALNNSGGTLAYSVSGSSDEIKQENDLIEAGKQVRSKAKSLYTVGLSVQDVTAAQTLLADTSKSGIASPGSAYLDDDADALGDRLIEIMVNNLLTLTVNDDTADVKDYISDSFYPVNQDGTALSEGDWITLEGIKTTADAKNAAGQVNKDDNGWYVEWIDQTLPANVSGATPWKGKIYIKAKEDFIGGNTIDTNKGEATISVKPVNVKSTFKLPTPTVNVRLLPMNEVTSEETVFLSDTISELQQKIKNLEAKVYFEKIKSGTGDELNKKDSADGLESDKFYLNYAMNETNLTSDQWAALFKGESVPVVYTYDDDSSHGAVGEFVITLTQASKEGETASLSNHEATLTGEDVETYTLKVEYKAYRITDTDGTGAAYADSTARSEDVHNYGNGPGTEVGSDGTTVLTDGYGTVTSTNVHTVNVVDGKITVQKVIDKSLKSNSAKTYEFTLMKQTGTDSEGKPVYEQVTDDSGDSVTLKATVAANTLESDKTAAQSSISNLPRGTYKLSEKTSDSDDYAPTGVKIIDDTNCKSTIVNGTEVVFEIGKDTDGNDVIETVASADSYNSVYTQLKSDADLSEGCASVSYGTAQITNSDAKAAQIQVKKNWDSALDTSDYESKDIYVALYKNTTAETVTVGDTSYVEVLKLSKASDWTGTFDITLPDKSTDISTLGYTVMELSEVTTTQTEGYQTGAVVNNASGTPSLIYYKDAVGDGIVTLGDDQYAVSVTSKMETVDGKSIYTIEATNNATYVLPQSGGIGTTVYTMTGLLLIGIGLMYGFYLRRLRERGSE